uniref:Cilia- and flagella-associated protein 53 n=1 Tax=Guillardia theta TaxID=55529 RepID=A0A6U6CNL8_GUITH|mmetsp:Transcript_47816/g.149939  ORF Transcript_47816/g.149939 Transcript_47816/m.149939 type:complete len:565 (+) Transcript_47816:528-2222(+)
MAGRSRELVVQSCSSRCSRNSQARRFSRCQGRRRAATSQASIQLFPWRSDQLSYSAAGQASSMGSRARSGHLAPDFMILNRRKAEDQRRVFDEKCKSDASVERFAHWEHKTAGKIERNTVTRKVETMKQDMKEELNERRSKLAALLAEEDARYTAELSSFEETPEMRRDRLKARARELMRRREQEKREFAVLMRERQFRESCDAFREHDGEQLLHECVVARERALEEKEENKQRQKEENEMWHNKLLDLVRKSEEREMNDKNRQMELRSEMLHTLQEQIQELQARRDEDERLKQEEARLMRERFELDLAEAKRKEHERAEMQAEKKLAVARHNALLRAEKDAEIRRQQEEDLKLLNAMLDKERRAEEAELQYKAQLRQQAREYQAQLIELMKKEAVDEAASEAIRKAEQEKAWRKREEVWEKERAAREKLMKEVLQTRREQLQQRIEQNRREREFAMEEKERMVREVDDIEQQNALQAEIRKRIAKEHQRDILTQIEEAKNAMRREMEIAALELEASRREEAAYQVCLFSCSPRTSRSTKAKLAKEMLVQKPLKNHGLKSTGLF